MSSEQSPAKTSVDDTSSAGERRQAYPRLRKRPGQERPNKLRKLRVSESRFETALEDGLGSPAGGHSNWARNGRLRRLGARHASNTCIRAVRIRPKVKKVRRCRAHARTRAREASRPASGTERSESRRGSVCMRRVDHERRAEGKFFFCSPRAGLDRTGSHPLSLCQALGQRSPNSIKDTRLLKSRKHSNSSSNFYFSNRAN